MKDQKEKLNWTILKKPLKGCNFKLCLVKKKLKELIIHSRMLRIFPCFDQFFFYKNPFSVHGHTFKKTIE